MSEVQYTTSLPKTPNRRDSTASTLPPLSSSSLQQQQQQVVVDQIDDSSHEITVFFHADATTRKVKLPSNLDSLTMDDVSELFIRTMNLPRYGSKRDLPAFYIQDRQTKIEYELVKDFVCFLFLFSIESKQQQKSDVKELYNSCLISIRVETTPLSTSRVEKSYILSTMKQKMVRVFVFESKRLKK